MENDEKRIALAKWILESDVAILNEVEVIYKTHSIDISENHKKILDERLKEHHNNPSKGKSWDNVRKELSTKYEF